MQTRMIAFFVILLNLLFMPAAFAKQSWPSWVHDFRQEALADGISSATFERAFDGLTPNRRLLRLDRYQPEQRLTYLKYRNTRGDAYRIKLGKRAYHKHRKILKAVEKQFGVSPCYVVALWGLESSYGHFMGSFKVVRSLATLAYDKRRAKFFRKELLHALHILEGGHVPLHRFKGEWAGGTGQPQFLPSSWRRYAVDFDNDGKRDIWRTHADIFASISNYLVKNGWKKGGPWGAAVTLPRGFDKKQTGYKHPRTVSEWQALGVKFKASKHFAKDLKAWIVMPYGGPALLVFNNFRVIMRYNHSTYYAGTVAYIADNICKRKI